MQAEQLYEKLYKVYSELIKPNMDSTISLSSDVFCQCKPYAMNASFKVVKKNGPNFGKGFFTCQKRNGSCGFFRWAEESEIPAKVLSQVKRDCPPTNYEPPAKKAKLDNNSSLDPTNKSYREMACELLYQRLESQEEVMKKSQEVSLEIAKLLAETTKNLKDLFDTVTAIRVVKDESDEEVEKALKNSNPFVEKQ